MPGFDLNTGATVYVGASSPTAMSGQHQAAGAPNAHYGAIGVVLLAALALILLDRAGFKFMVTVGRR